MHLDTVFEQLNPYGRYQIYTWLILSSFTTFPPAWHQFSITFTAYRPSEFGCWGTKNTTSSGVLGPNGTITYPTTARLPVEGHPCKYTLAHYNDNTSDAILLSAQNLSCNSGDFWYSKSDPLQSTIIKQWDLVCHREYISDMINTAEGVGEIFGCIIFGYLADRFGRKTGYFGSSAALFASGLLCAFAPHPIIAMIARLFIGISLTGMNNIGFLMNAELFTPDARTFFSTGGELVWGVAVVALTGVGFVIRDSFWFMVAITVPVVFVMPFWWFLSESLHWNLSKGHIEDARATLQRIARFNKVQLDETLIQKLFEEDVANERKVIHNSSAPKKDSNDDDNNSQNHNRHRAVGGPDPDDVNTTRQLIQEHLFLNNSVSTEPNSAPAPVIVQVPPKTSPAVSFSPSPFSSLPISRTSSVSTLDKMAGWVVLDLVRTPRLRMITIFLTLLWFANTMCYFGLQMAAQYINGVDFFLSFFILAVVEVPSVFFVVFPMHWLGRRWAIISFQIIGSISVIGVAFIPPEYQILTISIAAVGKFAVCASFTALYVYAAELFPTTVRGTGFGVISLIGRVGMIFAPLVNSIGYGESSFPPWARNMIYGLSMIATVFLTLPLPETTHQPLADTIEEMENYEKYCKNYHQANSAAAALAEGNSRRSAVIVNNINTGDSVS